MAPIGGRRAVRASCIGEDELADKTVPTKLDRKRRHSGFRLWTLLATGAGERLPARYHPIANTPRNKAPNFTAQRVFESTALPC